MGFPASAPEILRVGLEPSSPQELSWHKRAQADNAHQQEPSGGLSGIWGGAAQQQQLKAESCQPQPLRPSGQGLGSLQHRRCHRSDVLHGLPRVQIGSSWHPRPVTIAGIF